MIRLFILLFLLSADMMALAQKDNTLIKNNVATKTTYQEPIRLTELQQEWLNNNYKQVAGLKKDSAVIMIRKNLTSIPDASIEYVISQAAKLLQEDHTRQLVALRHILDRLKQQVQILNKEIQEKEDQLAKETDPDKKKTILNEIMELKKKVKELKDDIRSKEEMYGKLEASS
jgi:Mg2+ and Co2+ transporter CorA